MTSDWKLIIFTIAVYTFGGFVGQHNPPWYVGATGISLIGFFAGQIAGWINR